MPASLHSSHIRPHWGRPGCGSTRPYMNSSCREWLSGWQVSRLDLQRGRIIGFDRCHFADDDFRCIPIHGSSLLDPGVLDPFAPGDALRHVRYSIETLAANGTLSLIERLVSVCHELCFDEGVSWMMRNLTSSTCVSVDIRSPANNAHR